MARGDGSSKDKKAKTTSTRVPKRQIAAPSIARTTTAIDLGQQDRHRMIAEAAYYRAQQRGFCGGDPVQDWLEAEAEVSVRLDGGVPRGEGVFHLSAGTDNGFEVGNVPKTL